MPWFMQSLDRGFFEVVNPYNRRVTQVPASPNQIHSIVFWSKDFGPFIRQGHDRALTQRGYRLFFNFSINSPDPLLEPNLPSLDQRLDQLAHLAQRFGGECIQWRFDPICFYRSAGGPVRHNLAAFGRIARAAADAGVPVCITSFVDLYRKVRRRIARHPGLELLDPPLDEKASRLKALEQILAPLDIALNLCCEKQLLDAMPAGMNLQSAACIPGQRLVRLFGPGISLGRDPGQRTSAGCGCTLSRDIGSYSLHPCRHNCLYCYANPVDRGND